MKSVEFDPYYVTIPFFYHQSNPVGVMAGSFVDNGYRGHYEFSRKTEYRITFEGGQWTEYVFAGLDAAILEAYTWLTGRASLPPLWALGYHQCRWHAYTQDDVERLGDRHREDDFPCDGLWLDIDYMDGYRVFTWDQSRFPDTRSSSTVRQGIPSSRSWTLASSTTPGMPSTTRASSATSSARPRAATSISARSGPATCLSRTSRPRPAGRGGRAQRDTCRLRPGRDLERHERAGHRQHPGGADALRGRTRLAREYHNQYALLMAMGTLEGLRSARPELRTFILSRAGFAGSSGMPRTGWATTSPAGTTSSSPSRWARLRGVGTAVRRRRHRWFPGQLDAELFLRWMQMGVLTPFCRNHNEIGNIDQYAWAFGDVVHDLARDAVRLRYQLMPYIYAAFVRATETGSRCSARSSSTTSSSPRQRTPRTSTCSAGTCSSLR